LARVFAQKASAEFGIAFAGLSRAAEKALLRHGWPGNVRELENCMQRSLLEAGGSRIQPEHLGLKEGAPPLGTLAEIREAAERRAVESGLAGPMETSPRPHPSWAIDRKVLRDLAQASGDVRRRGRVKIRGESDLKLPECFNYVTFRPTPAPGEDRSLSPLGITDEEARLHPRHRRHRRLRRLPAKMDTPRRSTPPRRSKSRRTRRTPPRRSSPRRTMAKKDTAKKVEPKKDTPRRWIPPRRSDIPERAFRPFGTEAEPSVPLFCSYLISIACGWERSRERWHGL
jgi:hypothetical protein